MDEINKAKFKAMIDYQRKDIELRKINNELDKDKALVEMNVNKRAFNDAKQTIAECEQLAGDLLDIYAELQKYIDDNEALLNELESGDGKDEEELASRVKKLESLKSKFQSADKKMHDIEDRSKNVCSRRTEAVKSGNIAKQHYNAARANHGKLVESKSGEVNKLKAELAQMRESLDPKLLEEYNKLVAEGRFPPIVPASGDSKKNLYNCGGCGLELPQKGNAMLGDQGWFRCETCRRIIVKLN